MKFTVKLQRLTHSIGLYITIGKHHFTVARCSGRRAGSYWIFDRYIVRN